VGNSAYLPAFKTYAVLGVVLGLPPRAPLPFLPDDRVFVDMFASDDRATPPMLKIRRFGPLMQHEEGGMPWWTAEGALELYASYPKFETAD
jgi:hypothetical protein